MRLETSRYLPELPAEATAMKHHRQQLSGKVGTEECRVCGATRGWMWRQPWLLNGKPQPYCIGDVEYKEKNHEEVIIPVL